MLTFDDDDLTVDNGNRERAVFHHLWLCGGVTGCTEEDVEKLNTLGEQNSSWRRSWLIANSEDNSRTRREQEIKTRPESIRS